MGETNRLDRIDNYLKEKKSSELSLIFLMVFVTIGFVVYSLLFPVTEKMLKTAQKSHKNMKTKLNQEKSYLNSVTRAGDKNFVIKMMTKKIKQQKIILADTKYTNAYVDTKLKELSNILFNDKNWANFLDSIAFVAQEYGVELSLISNEFFEPNLQEIKQVLTVQINFNGEFKNIIKFINKLEESELVVDVHNLELQSTDTINGTLDIAVWGMRY
ncbi:type 4a pilus biogenesis protein PilO [Sulfurospirillum arcachonense]|uniref:type 4a pilus biogenesis protein PilO n=1 Tax=Sulfurospirillum arcachonense TaxID=57666 RepID=UPI00046A37FD|nr:type 4a pilus biogenesis protein PilO [Sulfurospirillum arcachonense]